MGLRTGIFFFHVVLTGAQLESSQKRKKEKNAKREKVKSTDVLKILLCTVF
eukprot:SAG11_NODE_36100_length_263_cov_0.902439_1_plen_50_part_10